jgi:hypothetical protein
MKYALLAAVLLSACATADAQPAACPPAGYDRASLEALKASEWTIADDAARNQLARALVACVASPDPALRDGIAFEGLTHWLRAQALSAETMRALAEELQPRLFWHDHHGFEQGFVQPFAALVLSEVVRADRIEPYLDPSVRLRILDHALLYYTSVRDYRGFDERAGWRHGVAHGADLLLQLSLNPAFGKPEVERIRDALSVQVAPEGHFYIYGEPGRIARPIIFMAQRGLFTEDEWTRWFVQFAAAEDSYTSQAGLARVHNIRAFLEAVLVGARLSESEVDDALLAGAEAAYRAIP